MYVYAGGRRWWWPFDYRFVGKTPPDAPLEQAGFGGRRLINTEVRSVHLGLAANLQQRGHLVSSEQFTDRRLCMHISIQSAWFRRNT